VPDKSRKPVRSRHTRRSTPTVGSVLLWGFFAISLAYAVLLIVLGLTR
jgi:hypothetical protein